MPVRPAWRRPVAGWFLLALVLTVLLPFLVVLTRGLRIETPQAPAVPLDPGQLPVRVWIPGQDSVQTLPLEVYLTGVVAAEMPASFHIEALKAQAVAARTYTVRQMQVFGGPGCREHAEADVCGDPQTGQAWQPLEARRRDWGLLNGWRFARKIQQAVQETAGLILVYQGAPIDAVYHSTSGGRTEDASAVWGNQVPYLRPVDSPWETASPHWRSTRTMTLQEFARRLEVDPKVVRDLPGDQCFARVESSPGGRVGRATVGEKVFTGPQLRQRLELPSTWWTCRRQGEQLTFTIRGWGHGVGMSQYGADGMARQGYSYQEILRHYYPGTSLRPIFSE
ncbi:stage II sporulation protein D [Thermaerobacter sp. PB12/4term]|uniref:stage II sporulation protein D n=1 Tax=Thermaerobacter sp. PB12/4term TaxID=2293838 RepID=UPI000E32CB5D|nr:stage II sporulation protein D [Thermaerobacter sp. PB12/4term]QIA26235.1 stage II sporulation protein D [Thermaerobacter sp. PB12/4term]